MNRNKKRIVVLGGGFAGVECVRQLESEFGDSPEIELVMISEDNFLLFTPMLPQVASGMIETRHIVLPIRTICKKTKFYEGRIKNIDPYGKIVTLWGTGDKRSISIHYDFLVIGLGSETNFFGMADVKKNAFTMKTLNDAVSGPYFYGYTMTVGPDGKPVVKEYGNVKPGLIPTSDTREPIVDTIIDEKEKEVKLIAEMPGVEKTDVKIVVENKIVDLSAEHGEKKYHVKVPVKHKVDENSAKASYKNGILQLIFKLVDEKPKGKRVEVE